MSAYLNALHEEASRETLFAEVVKLYEESEAQRAFLLEVCEEIFGCYMQTTYTDGEAGFLCGICEKEVSAKNWIHAAHNDGCVIPRVRDYLAKHKPSVLGKP